MKLVILAGGKGTRLGLTNIPKPMVEVCNKPLLLHQVELAKSYGIKEIIILSGHLATVIFDYFKDGSAFGVKISHILEPHPLGTAGSVKLIENFIKDEHFLLFYGDLMLNLDLKKLINYHKKQKALATLVVHPNDHPYDSDLLEMDKNGYITAFHPKPHNRHEYYKNLVNAAVYVLSRKIFSYIPFGKHLDFGKDVFPELLKNGEKLAGYKTTEYIKDVGTKERLLEVEKDFTTGRVANFNKKNKKKAIFLDRDGVINEEVILLHKLEDFKLLSKVGSAIKCINNSNYLAVVVTNQPVVARNLCSLTELEKIHAKMETLLGQEGAYLDGIYFCPHHPDKGFPEENPDFKIECDCRKPKTGLIKQAIKELNIDLNGSYIIGDTQRDIECGKNLGITTIGVRTGYGCKNLNRQPDYLFDDLYDAVNFIVKEPYESYFLHIRDTIRKSKKRPFIITIAGNTRSGKTILSTFLKNKFNKEGLKTKVIELDNWLLPKDKRTKDMDVFKRYQLNKLDNDCKAVLDGKIIKIKRYEPLTRTTMAVSVNYFIGNSDIVIFEGVIAFAVKSLVVSSDLKIFCDIEEDLLFKRMKKFYEWKGLSEQEILKLFKDRKVDEYDIICNYKKYADLVIKEYQNDNC